MLLTLCMLSKCISISESSISEEYLLSCIFRKTAKFKVDAYSNRKTGPGELMIQTMEDIRVSLLGCHLNLLTRK